MKFSYMKESEEQIQYYQFPKILLRMKLSQNARIIYMLLYDRSRISQKNKWLDEEKREFAIFPLDKLSKESGICQTSTKKALKELSENGLLIRKSVGFSKPKHLYVLLPDEESYIRGENETDENKAAIKSESQLSDSRDDDCMKVAKEASSKVIEKENINNNNRVIGGKGKRKKEYSKEVDYSCEEGESL